MAIIQRFHFQNRTLWRTRSPPMPLQKEPVSCYAIHTTVYISSIFFVCGFLRFMAPGKDPILLSINSPAGSLKISPSRFLVAEILPGITLIFQTLLRVFISSTRSPCDLHTLKNSFSFCLYSLVICSSQSDGKIDLLQAPSRYLGGALRRPDPRRPPRVALCRASPAYVE